MAEEIEYQGGRLIPVSPELIHQIADEYTEAAHRPFHPSYGAFINETIEQFKRLRGDGWTFQLTNNTPYKTSELLFRDLEQKHLWVYTGANFAKWHPLRLRAEGTVLSVNETFRAVHDILGHGATKCPFETLNGEIEAYQNHAKQYSNEAGQALYGETIGQLCHYYSGRGFVKVQECKIISRRI